MRGSLAPGFWCRETSKVAGGSEFLAHSPTLNERRHPDGTGWRPGSRVSLALVLGVLNPQRCGTRPLGKGTSGANLGLGLAPMRLTGRSPWLCGEQIDVPR